MDAATFAGFKANYGREIAAMESRAKALDDSAAAHAALPDAVLYAGTIRSLKARAENTRKIVAELKAMLSRAEKQFHESPVGASLDSAAVVITEAADPAANAASEPAEAGGGR